MTRPHWDFDYRLVTPGYAPLDADDDVVFALDKAASLETLGASLDSVEGLVLETLLVRPPLFWYRLRSSAKVRFEDVERALERRGLGCRYATSAVRGSLALGEPLTFADAPPATASDWKSRGPSVHDEPRSPSRWVFHEPGGIDVDRAVCGTGAGMRLGVIDDEGMDSDALALDGEVFVGTDSPSRAALHGSLMVGWAVGVRGHAERAIPQFTGIAPDASPRLYLIPKPGRDVVSLPCAIVRAVDDGADVVVCATYVEGTTSPLLDDALAFASSLGRDHRGTAVVLPTGREISSPRGSMHASLSLSPGDPASDPRVLCVAPSSRGGGWFLWPDKRGRLRPFANRGPAVRLAAPGDDMSYPFAKRDRLGHAESSGASAVAAGVALLVLGTNPELRVSELYELLEQTTVRGDGAPPGPVADPEDLLPSGRDPDGHDAKTGYGRVSAARACLVAADPIARALLELGEEAAARRHLSDVRDGATTLGVGYSRALALWAARTVRRDASLTHELRALVRHVRLVSRAPERRPAHPVRSLTRRLALFVGSLLLHDAPPGVVLELSKLRRLAIEASRNPAVAEPFEDACFDAAARLFGPPT
ncbi:MAG TPA: S8 family serine peptidase [Polyangiaceae bacterium]|jgi:hypothetical protein|nr:S8 family serine peptidase [Polyangiaceae bacterium]